MKKHDTLVPKYYSPSLQTIENWLKEGYASNYHVDNTNFNSEEKLVQLILLKQHITIDAVELNESNSSKLIFANNYVLKTLIDFKNTTINTAFIRRLNLLTIRINVIDTNTKEAADKALELLNKL